VPDPKTLAALRSLVAAWTPPDWRNGVHVSTGVRAVDEALGGGLPQGRLTELVSAPGAGGQFVLAQILRTARAVRQRVALIDAADAFAPESIPSDDLRHLVWARAGNLRAALAVADVLVRDGNFAIVVLDLRDVPARELNRTPKSAWHRIHRVAERQPAAVLVQSHHSVVPAVGWRLALPRSWRLADQRSTREELAAALSVETMRGHGAEELAG
jgi:RecA DNA recombination protein